MSHRERYDRKQARIQGERDKQIKTTNHRLEKSPSEREKKGTLEERQAQACITSYWYFSVLEMCFILIGSILHKMQ